VIDRQVSDGRAGQVLERAAPLLDMFGVTPAGRLGFDVKLRTLTEAQNEKAPERGLFWFLGDGVGLNPPVQRNRRTRFRTTEPPAGSINQLEKNCSNLAAVTPSLS